MARCAQCGEEIADTARFCSVCGRPTNPDSEAVTIAVSPPTSEDVKTAPPAPNPESEAPTIAVSVTQGLSAKTPTPTVAPTKIGSDQPTVAVSIQRTATAKPPSTMTSSTLLAGATGGPSGRFAAGDVLLGRYRVVSLLGRGGMGEVYRADDLVLGQSVALKFLPASVAQDPGRIERFRAEVRNSRQVSHPNVCRVYDIAEVEGQPFISMEFVEGEDLGSLLKRIGRLPQPKGIEIARQICAGLAASHAMGVLHRDLKPGNVMLDKEGRARITDFGIAIRGDQVQKEGEIAGTPAYMAPEQFAGKPASVKTDIYSLGLVLYEIFTGKKAVQGATLQEVRQKHAGETPASPSTLVAELDPAVERVIFSCLEKDPRARPASALAVAAALPGGDPLAAALAAGETPSPELVAAAGVAAGLRPRTALLLISFVVVGLVGACLLVGKTQLTAFAPLPYPPDILRLKARDLLKKLGDAAPPKDAAEGFDYDAPYLQYIQAKNHSPHRWRELESREPSPIIFWYRESPVYLERQSQFSDWEDWEIEEDDPALTVPGMVYVQLDSGGRLQELKAVPSPGSARPNQTPDWSVLFNAAKLDMTQFTPAAPQGLPPAASDHRFAWAGTDSNRPIRVEGASYQGQIVYFRVLWPWSHPSGVEAPAAGSAATFTMFMILFVVVVLAAVLLAHRNLRLGRGDRKGAFRLAVFVFAVASLSWAVTAHHVPTSHEFGQWVIGLSSALFFAVIVWLLYIALEPWVRRRWPTAMISWSRTLAGQFRDPLLGRDVLIGVALGVAMNLWLGLMWFAEKWFGKLPPAPAWNLSLDPLQSSRDVFSILLRTIPIFLSFSLAIFLFFFLLRMLVRKDWAAAILFVGVLVAARSLSSPYPVIDALFLAGFYGVVVFTLKQFGLTPVIVLFVVNAALSHSDLTSHFSAWYALPTIFGALFVLALAAYGFRNAVGNQPLFSPATLDS